MVHYTQNGPRFVDADKRVKKKLLITNVGEKLIGPNFVREQIPDFPRMDKDINLAIPKVSNKLETYMLGKGHFRVHCGE